MERLDSVNSVEQEGSAFTPAPRGRAPRKQPSASKLTEWQRFFLSRLDYMLQQRQPADQDAGQATLLSKAIYSTYLDCQSQGIGDEALQRISASGSNAPSAN
ncbi:MAG TPA: hypothetical protein VF157_04995 [Chloroflexota bacterium]